MKSFYRTGCFFAICFVLVLNSFGPVFAIEPTTPIDDPLEPDPYTYVSLITIGLSVDDDDLATISSDTALNLTYYSYTVKLTMQLQRSTNGSNWTTLKTWTATGTGDAALSKNRYLNHGYYYRNYVTVEVKSGDTVLETIPAEYSIYY